MTEDFSKNLVKEYKYWEISVNENQGYLGRCIVWCKREDALDLTDATPEEQAELFLVLRDLIKASKKAFQPDWFNYSFLGNAVRHLHCHFIPRHSQTRTFMNVVFKDTLYGHNYKTDPDFKTSKDLLYAIRDQLKSAF